MTNSSYTNVDQNSSKHGHDHVSMVKYGYWVVLSSAIMICAVLPLVSAYMNRRRMTHLQFWLVTTLWCLGIVSILIRAQPSQVSLWAKLLGRVTYASLPLILILSSRPFYLTSASYLWVLQWHKWIARVTGVIALAHGILYSWHFVRAGEVYKMFHPRNFLGLVALAYFFILALFSLRPIRRRYYSIFYTSHYISAWAIVLSALIHARPNVFFLATLCICVLALQVLLRIKSARGCVLEVQNYGGSMMIVTLTRSMLPQRFDPGCHIRLAPPLSSWQAWLQPSHPYTIASLDTDDSVKLVIRRTKFDLQEWSSYSITGPYSSSCTNWQSSTNVLLISGGSGISLAVPILRRLTFDHTPCKCVWITSQAEDIDVLKELKIDMTNIVVYLTADLDGPNKPPKLDSESMELEELLPTASADDERYTNIQYGKPSIKEIIEEHIRSMEGVTNSSMSVVACGPASLIQDAEKVAIVCNISFDSEEYSI